MRRRITYEHAEAGTDKPELGSGFGVVRRELHLDEDLGLLDSYVPGLSSGDCHGVNHEGVLGQILTQVAVIVEVLQANVPAS